MRPTGPHPFCGAPSTNLRVDADGAVRACGPMPQVLGTLRDDDLETIWASGARLEVAAAIEGGSTERGCAGCLRALLRDEPQAPVHDYLPVASTPLPRPRSLELSLGPESGPATGFDERFFAQVTQLAAGLALLRVVGPDPFSSPVVLELLDRVAAGPRPDRVELAVPARRPPPAAERFLRAVPTEVTVRLAGAGPATLGAFDPDISFDEAMTAIEQLQGLLEPHGRRLRLVLPLRRETWPELGELLLRADRWKADVAVEPVTEPVRARLDTLPPELLAEVVASLERQDAALRPMLHQNRSSWLAAVALVRGLHDQAVARSTEDAQPPDLRLAASFAAHAEASQALPASVTADAHDVELRDGELRLTGVLRCDLSDRVTWTSARFLGLPAAQCLDRSFAEVGVAVDESLGVGRATSVRRRLRGDELHWEIHHPTHPRATVVEAVTRAERADDGRLVGTYTRAVARREDASAEATREAMR